MVVRWLTSIMLVCFGLLILVALQLSKKPLCIDSKVVEKIDRVANAKVETVFRCAVNRDVPFNSFFDENSKILSVRIQKTERVLESIEPFQRKVQIIVRSDFPYFFQVRDHQVFIGDKLLLSPGHLEKGLIKVWFHEKNESFFAQLDLMEEVVTDFLFFLQSGNLNLADPDSKFSTTVGGVQWPHVIKSVSAYCESPWKRSEHYSICRNNHEAESALTDKVIDLSLRPLIVASWIEAFKSLNGAERSQFLKNFAQFLKASRTPSLPLIDALSAENTDRIVLTLATTAIKNMNSFVTNAGILKNQETYRIFASSLTKTLQQKGLQDSFAEAFFDVLYVSKTPLDVHSSRFQYFEKLATKHPYLQMAIMDSENLWMLPSRYGVSVKSFGQLKAQNTIIEKCGSYNFEEVIDFSERTQKLLVVNHCDKERSVEFSGYLKSGAEGFAIQNKGVTFVQFHLPSLAMKKVELAGVSNVLEFIQKRDLESVPFQSLGWQEVQWSKQADAYQPKAFVDAIEWFRIIN